MSTALPSPNGGIVASMSRTGDCYDNAVAESFFASLTAEWVDREDYADHDVNVLTQW